jgi:pseudouridine synthase
MKSKKEMTLDRVLSRFGLASRSGAQEVIRSGRIKVNGRVVREPETWVDVERDPMHIDGERLRPVRKCYFLFYKPKGVITSNGDPDGRKTVYDCLDALGILGKKLPWIAPVGRLDQDTSGLLLLTNDTDFADHVASPDSGVQKTYLVKANMIVADGLIERMAQGVELKRGDWARPLSVRRVEDRGKYSWLEIVLTEGKNREIRRLLETMGLQTLKLVRTHIGPCTLEGMQVGKCRPLTPTEVSIFRSRTRQAP